MHQLLGVVDPALHGREVAPGLLRTDRWLRRHLLLQLHHHLFQRELFGLLYLLHYSGVNFLVLQVGMRLQLFGQTLTKDVDGSHQIGVMVKLVEYEFEVFGSYAQLDQEAAVGVAHLPRGPVQVLSGLPQPPQLHQYAGPVKQHQRGPAFRELVGQMSVLERLLILPEVLKGDGHVVEKAEVVALPVLNFSELLQGLLVLVQP